jgi:Ni/Co efflux regulator RcnB
MVDGHRFTAGYTSLPKSHLGFTQVLHTLAKIRVSQHTRRLFMTPRAFLPLAIAVALGLGATSTFAETHDKRGRVIIIEQHGADRQDRQHDRREDRMDNRRERAQIRAERYDDRRNDRSSRREDRRESRHDRRDHRYPGVHYYYNARGPEFVRGHRLPRDLRIPQYVVVNPRHHHLSPPPRGHHWVQVGGDYVLVAIATGIIANIIFNH